MILTNKFIADDMVGKLARFLRILGYDTVYEIDIDNNRLIDIALREDRIILTRDTELIQRTLVKNYLLLESDNPEEQLRSVIEHFGLKPSQSGFLSLCLECNRELDEIPRSAIKGRVWPYVYDHHDEFRICKSCRRIYWRGDHVHAMIARLRKWGIELTD